MAFQRLHVRMSGNAPITDLDWVDEDLLRAAGPSMEHLLHKTVRQGEIAMLVWRCIGSGQDHINSIVLPPRCRLVLQGHEKLKFVSA
eukprot:5989920-Amphidinium_carterae.2